MPASLSTTWATPGAVGTHEHFQNDNRAICWDFDNDPILGELGFDHFRAHLEKNSSCAQDAWRSFLRIALVPLACFPEPQELWHKTAACLSFGGLGCRPLSKKPRASAVAQQWRYSKVTSFQPNQWLGRKRPQRPAGINDKLQMDGYHRLSGLLNRFSLGFLPVSHCV